LEPICYLDLDDFQEQTNELDLLWKLKERFPYFKVNLFAIPIGNSDESWREYIKSLDWIQFCVHGFFHVPNEEVPKDTLILLSYSGYSKVYRAPCWDLSDQMYQILKELEFKILLHPTDPRDGIKFNWNIKDSPPNLDILYGHGHIGYGAGNGLEESFENIIKLPEKTDFRFF